MLFMTSLHSTQHNTLWTAKKKKRIYSTSIGHQNGEGKETLWECTMFSLRQYWLTPPVTICCLKCLTTLECPFDKYVLASTQYFLNSHTFFTFWFIWWTGSRKMVIDNVSALSCLTKTWSNDIHCQARGSLGLFLWRGQPRIDFNKIQCWQQPWKNTVWQNLRKFLAATSVREVPAGQKSQ